MCAIAVAALLAAPSVSYAGNFWYGSLNAGATGWGNQVIVQSVYAYAESSSKKISVGLYNYASFTTQWYYACHPYANQQYDWPGVNNPHTVQQNPVQAYTQVTNVC